MVDFDFIIISNALTEEHKMFTENCIKSILDTADIYSPHIIVVEQNNNTEYENTLTLHYDFEFNYNHCLNYGLKHSISPYKALCNNDLIFHEEWCEDVLKGFKLGFGSLSPYCLNSHSDKFETGKKIITGSRVGHELAGWCIFLTDRTLNKIGHINDKVKFWYSDNIYVEQLSSNEIKHGLVCSSFVTHLGSKTLNMLRPKRRVAMTKGQKKTFEYERDMIRRNKRNEKLI